MTGAKPHEWTEEQKAVGPGPWRLRRWKSDPRSIAVEDAQGSIVTVFAGYAPRVQKNARLTAAAPEMRELLETAPLWLSSEPEANELRERIGAVLRNTRKLQFIPFETVETLKRLED